MFSAKGGKKASSLARKTQKESLIERGGVVKREKGIVLVGKWSRKDAQQQRWEGRRSTKGKGFPGARWEGECGRQGLSSVERPIRLVGTSCLGGERNRMVQERDGPCCWGKLQEEGENIRTMRSSRGLP